MDEYRQRQLAMAERMLVARWDRACRSDSDEDWDSFLRAEENLKRLRESIV